VPPSSNTDVGADKAALWRARVDAQDGYAAAAQAKAAALARKEEATATWRAVLAHLEAAVLALTDAEAALGAASELARQAAQELDARLQVTHDILMNATIFFRLCRIP
jgi:exonuclease VII small subunit